ncbi:MAG: hypothetical protein GYA55_02530 [SAR324 cluster bacterium]|uniref:Uncharacterized protein n=1 Tax=SAR324 cluster bacterium TaxID=2024889 RepID=A0A7X9IJF7_9DELT|nr:hypothetical protein [SAR324 cluster bacterium]
MRITALICAILVTAIPVFGEGNNVFQKSFSSAIQYDFALSHQTTKRILPLAVEINNIERLQKDTGCNASGIGAATFGCDFYETHDNKEYLKTLSLRAGIARNAVGMGLNLTW